MQAALPSVRIADVRHVTEINMSRGELAGFLQSAGARVYPHGWIPHPLELLAGGGACRWP